MRMRLIGWLLLYLMIAGLTVSCGRKAETAGGTIWRIGNFDYSSSEFSHAHELLQKAQVVYEVGKSTPGKDWPFFQPGSANAGAGARPHPFTIKFNLAGPPKGLYQLKVGLLVEDARLPQLEVQVNGHIPALFYQHPKLNYAGGDREMVVSPIASADTIVADIPDQDLQAGPNTLVLTALNEPSTPDKVIDTGLVYDALELDQDPRQNFDANQISAQVVPTIFYSRAASGLDEQVDVYVRDNSAAQQGQVDLQIGKAKLVQPLSPKWGFGEQLAQFNVPEFAPGTKGEVTVTTGSQSRQFPVALTPAKKWTIFVVPHIHIDVGYTDYQAKVAEVQSRVLDEAIHLIHDHPDFRFSPDGYWAVQQFLAGRRAADQKQLFQLVKENKIFVPPQDASLLTGFPSLETLIRSLYSGFEFNQQHGGSFDYANITDVPSYTWSYASVLAAAGLKYFVAGCDNDNGPIELFSRLNEQSPFWWEGPDGGRILMWYSRSYSQVWSLFGMPPEIDAGQDSLPIFLQAYSHPNYKANAVLVFGTQYENSDLFPQQAELADNWNKVYAYPQLQYSGVAHAMSVIAGQFGASIPVVRGDGGPYWEFGIGSTAYTAAVERETEQRALGAETFSTISSLVNDRVKPEQAELKQAYQNMILYDEHTWGSWGSVSDPKSRETTSQLDVKEAFALNAKRDVNYVLRRSLAAIADTINDPKGTLIVFNPLSWTRSDAVVVDLRKGLEPVDLSTNQPVPYQVIYTSKSYEHIRFMARDVPPVGYKCYALKPVSAEPPAPSASRDRTLENTYYRVVLDPATGSVKSIYDKQLHKELVNTSSPYRFDQYVYVTGGDHEPNRLLEYMSSSPLPQLAVHGSWGGEIVSVDPEPFGTVARLKSVGVNTPEIDTEVILFNHQKKIEFINRVHKKTIYKKEGVYFAFPFAMDHPQFQYDIQNGYVDPARDQMPGAGKEWFSVQHWVACRQDGATVGLVPVDAPLVTLGDIWRGTWPKEFGQRPCTIFSFPMNNYYFTNYAAAQGGKFTYKYVFTSGADLPPAHLSRFGWDAMSPLETDEIIPNDKEISWQGPLASTQDSFLRVDQPNVVLVTWKRAEDQKGTILRFVEIGGKEESVRLKSPLLKISSAWECNAMEVNQQSLPVSADGISFSVKPYQIVTVRVQGTRTLP